MRPHYCLTVLVASLLVEPLFTQNGDVMEPAKPEKQELRSWYSTIRIVGAVVFLSIMLMICFTSCWRCHGASEDTTHPSPQNSHDALHATHIYDNDQ
ncbi:hypothetical protein CgunFtcFv8_018548 [Champsocephalus gunnari]|uniref:FXYD domain-containing ion transport regulator n=1 Tax=Champsocephalus gunnari TaxID=52237 RepID=A0AAN8GUX2_CHAGU|nr:hypothetical protein CgunFtcFv8_018548 [Champsocephalus gunnari]